MGQISKGNWIMMFFFFFKRVFLGQHFLFAKQISHAILTCYSDYLTSYYICLLPCYCLLSPFLCPPPPPPHPLTPFLTLRHVQQTDGGKNEQKFRKHVFCCGFCCCGFSFCFVVVLFLVNVLLNYETERESKYTDS